MFNKIWPFLVAVALSGLVTANPMRPDNNVAPPKSSSPAPTPVPRTPQLSSIVVIGDYRLAFFNSDIGRELGDVISGHKITTIEPTYVIVERNNKTTRLEIQSTGALSIEPTDEDTKL